MIISRSSIIGVRNVSGGSCQEKIKTHVLYSTTFSESRAIYEITWKNTVQPGGPHMTLRYGASALHAGSVKVQAHTIRNTACRGNICYQNAPHF